jgi:oligopeptide/dipeptide ABC transporter ATP-binding protein
MTSQHEPLLELRNLTTIFPLRRGVVQAVTGVDLTLGRGEILGLVGESGCGKSVTMLSILRLVPYPGQTVAGEILFEGQDLLQLPPGEMRKARGKEIAMIFQDPMSTLNPVFSIGEQIGESLRIHGLLDDGNRRLPWPFDKLRTWPFDRLRTWPFDRARRRAEQERTLKVLGEVGIPTPAEASRRYPHEYSGGMQQRALIAIALSCEPEILLADEPTTALDVTVQAQIMDLLNRINREHGTSIILVTHDLGLAAEFCQNIAVMYAGRIVEKGATDEVIEDPKHPYTQGLLACIPRIRRKRQKIHPIPGIVPDLINLPLGCAFHPRCEFAREECLGHEVPLVEVEPGRMARCILYTGTG